MSHNETLFHQTKQEKLIKYLPEFVYGGIDGLVTTFAVVAGATGASLPLNIVLILGFANLFADGFSMSVGAYLANKSEHDNYKKHLATEYREIEHLREKEVEEVREIYATKGFAGELLEQVVNTIIADNDRRVEVMMKEELGLSEPDKQAFPVALSTLIAFIILGFIPLFSYVVAHIGYLEDASLFPLAIGLTAGGFIVIGRLKSYVNQTNKRKAVLETVVLGGLAAGVAYRVGDLLEKMIG